VRRAASARGQEWLISAKQHSGGITDGRPTSAHHLGCGRARIIEIGQSPGATGFVTVIDGANITPSPTDAGNSRQFEIPMTYLDALPFFHWKGNLLAVRQGVLPARSTPRCARRRPFEP